MTSAIQLLMFFGGITLAAVGAGILFGPGGALLVVGIGLVRSQVTQF
jgi:hypothetical protein